MSMLINERAQRGLRGRNKHTKLARIERAARALFKQRGFEATTTRAIAKRAQIATGTLFLYFPEKRDLLLHLFRREVEPVLEQAFAALPASASLVNQLFHIFGALYDQYARDADLARMFMKELQFLDESRRVEMFTLTLGFFERLARLVEAAKARGEVAEDVDVMHATYVFFSLYYLCLVTWLGGTVRTRDSLDVELRTCLELVVRGVGGERS